MESPKLKSCVVLGYTDITAAGSRALLGLDREKFTVFPLSLKSLNGNSPQPASLNGSVPNLEAAALICEHKTRDVSFIIVNVVVPAHLSHVVANEIIDIVTSCNVKEFIVLSALPTGSDSTYLKIIDKDVDRDLTLKLSCADPFLNSLLQFTKVERFGTLLIAVDGRKAKEGSTPNAMDGSKQAVEALFQFLGGELELDLIVAQSLAWVFNGGGPSTDNDVNMYI